MHSWHKLYRLIARLPSEGQYKSALVMDRAYAEKVARAEAAGLIAPPPDEDTAEVSPLRYGPVEQRLDLIIDMLQYLRVTVHVGNGGDAEPVTPMPRPTTALAKARQQIEQAELLKAAEDFMSGFLIQDE